MEQQDEGSAEFKRLKAIVDGDGSEIRRQFIYAGLLLTIFERFKEYVVNQVDSFFAHRFEMVDGNLTTIRSEEFKTLIKEHGTGDPGQHGNRVFRAALRWLHSLDAIEQEELDHVEHLYVLRNEIGHELFGIIADDTKQPIKLADVVMAFGIYVRVVRWWIKEIDAATDPDMTQEKYDSANWDEAESADTVFLRMILQRSLAGDPDWEALQKALREMTDSGPCER